jgi:hypothetical protein
MQRLITRSRLRSSYFSTPEYRMVCARWCRVVIISYVCLAILVGIAGLSGRFISPDATVAPRPIAFASHTIHPASTGWGTKPWLRP